MRVIGYTYEADMHCISCAQKHKFKINPIALNEEMQWDEHGISTRAVDREGNPIGAIFSTDEQLEPFYCGDCRERIE